jgi:hypothetical protein
MSLFDWSIKQKINETNNNNNNNNNGKTPILYQFVTIFDLG